MEKIFYAKIPSNSTKEELLECARHNIVATLLPAAKINFCSVVHYYNSSQIHSHEFMQLIRKTNICWDLIMLNNSGDGDKSLVEVKELYKVTFYSVNLASLS